MPERNASSASGKHSAISPSNKNKTLKLNAL
jgi:hypothetical protein